jgi:ADP-ribose pyrophosphatase YjhB (NUDIX family)
VLPDPGNQLLAVDRALDLYGTAGAAVAILLRERDGTEILFMERARRESDPWSGQWSLPGGRRQAGESLLDAVRRETEEEVHLRPDPADLLGCLAARSPANRPELLVLPFVFRWDGGEPRPGPEVARTAWIPLPELPGSRVLTKIRVRGFERDMPAFVHEGRTIWGFTYRAIEDLLLPLG